MSDSNATCTNQPGDYDCECNDGYSGDGAVCSDVNECLDKDVCDRNAFCSNNDGSFICTCNYGYIGDGFNSCDKLDDLAVYNQATQKWACPTGYHGSPLSCNDDNECYLNPCSTHAFCTNSIGSFECECNDGYRGDGFICQDINECSTTTCDNASCVNTDGSFYCDCNSGYIGDGFNCEKLDERAEFDSVSGLWSCPEGFSRTEFECENVNECLDISAECHQMLIQK